MPGNEKAQPTKMGEAAWQNTSLAISDDPNAKGLLDALVEAFNKIKLDAEPKCEPHDCSKIDSVSQLFPATAIAVSTESRPTQSREKDESKEDAETTGDLGEPISDLAPKKICEKLTGVAFVSGDSEGEADFKIKFKLGADSGTAKAGAEFEFTVTGHYSIKISSDPNDKSTIPALRVTKHCTGIEESECVDEEGVVSVKVRSTFDLKLVGKGSVNFEIAGFKFIKLGGGAAAGQIECALKTSATSTARIKVSCGVI